jgi:hypothetical protein
VKKGPRSSAYKKVLSEKQFAEYERLKNRSLARKGIRAIGSYRSEEARVRYRSSPFARYDSGLQTLRRISRGSRVGIKVGGRGRPKGTFDSRYAAYGGVYGYRKVLAAQLRQQRFNQLQASTVSPQQQLILDQIRAREEAKRTNPENQAIPDTSGRVDTRSIHREADDYSRLFP